MISDKTGVVAFAFGTPQNIPSNERLAELAVKFSSNGRFPIYTQPDIKIPEGIGVEYIEEDEGEPSPTLRMARAAIAWAKEHGICRLWVIAAEPHMYRCKRDLRVAAAELGVRHLELMVPRRLSTQVDRYWFNQESTQKRTQSRANWRLREWVLCNMPLWLYKQVAS